MIDIAPSLTPSINVDISATMNLHAYGTLIDPHVLVIVALLRIRLFPTQVSLFSLSSKVPSPWHMAVPLLACSDPSQPEAAAIARPVFITCQ